MGGWKEKCAHMQIPRVCYTAPENYYPTILCKKRCLLDHLEGILTCDQAGSYLQAILHAHTNTIFIVLRFSLSYDIQCLKRFPSNRSLNYPSKETRFIKTKLSAMLLLNTPLLIPIHVASSQVTQISSCGWTFHKRKKKGVGGLPPFFLHALN